MVQRHVLFLFIYFMLINIVLIYFSLFMKKTSERNKCKIKIEEEKHWHIVFIFYSLVYIYDKNPKSARTKSQKRPSKTKKITVEIRNGVQKKRARQTEKQWKAIIKIRRDRLEIETLTMLNTKQTRKICMVYMRDEV